MTSASDTPTELIELRSGAARLRIAPGLGGRILDLALVRPNGRTEDVLAPFPEGARVEDLLHWPKGGLYPLVPYSNRIRDGRLLFDEYEYVLPPHPDAAPHALHGHGHRVPWSVTREETSSAAWALTHDEGEEWPWPFLATMNAELSSDAVIVGLSLRNTSPRAMPAGIGFHPYLLCGAADTVSFETRIDWPTTPDMLATGSASHPHEPQSGRAFAPGDHTLYRSGWDGRFTLSRESGTVVELSAGPPLDHLVVHRPAGSPYLCVEPVSHVADGFNVAERGHPGTGRIALEPGQTCEGSMRLALVG